MSRKLKGLGVIAAVVCAFSAVGVANASAQSFEATKVPGQLLGHAGAEGEESTQVFIVNGGTVECTEAKTTGEVIKSPATEQKVKVEYSGCTAFGIVSVNISPAEYNLHAAGSVDVLNTITIDVSGLCTVTVGPQKGLEKVSYRNNAGKIIEESDVTGIAYTSSGGLCGASGENGVYTGNNEVEEIEGSLTFVP